MQRLGISSIIVIFTAILTGCNPDFEINLPTSEPDLRAPYMLKASPLRDEVIEASVNFIAPGVVGTTEVVYQYELNIRNNIHTSLLLKQIDVIDPFEPAQPLARFSDEALQEIFDTPGIRPSTGNLELIGNRSGSANLVLSVPKHNLPAEIFHRLVFIVQSGDNSREYTMEVARYNLPPPSTLTIRPPVDAGNWAYFTFAHSNTRQLIEGNAIYPQRFALDMAKVSPEGRFAKNDSGANESYYSYGQDILAVADGHVIAIREDLEDNDMTSGKTAVEINRETSGGNYVFVRIGDGTNAFYGHLMPGSVTVKPGERVKRGQVIGKLGNSGNSDGPHLHFHLETATPLNRPLTGNGIPFQIHGSTEIDRYSMEELEMIFERNSILNRESKLTRGPHSLFLRNGLLKIE